MSSRRLVFRFAWFRVYSRKLVFILSALAIAGGLILTYGYFFSNPAEAAWFNDSWKFRKKLTIDNTKVSDTGAANYSNFPVLVSLTNDASLRANAQSDGDDIAFTDSTGAQIDHEIESYDATKGTLTAWVEVPTLDYNDNTIIYMYYGNPSASSQENINGAGSTWNSNYAGVWHMANGTTLSANDSTSNNNDGTITGATAGVGKIDGAGSFSGSTQYIDIGNGASLRVTGNITISAWVKPSDFANTNGIMGKTSNGIPVPYDLYLVQSTGIPRFYRADGLAPAEMVDGSSAPSANTWSYITVTMSGTAVTHYLNGSSNGTGSISITPTDAGTAARIASRDDSGTMFKGGMDEVRISNSARSAGWIATEYNNQNDPAAFFSVGGEETHRGPILYLGFDEGTGSTAYDSSPSKNNGTITGAAWKSEDLCVFGKCLYFDGSDDYVGVGSTAPNVQSVSFWVKPQSTSEYLIDFDSGTHYISASSGTISATGFTSPAIYVNGKRSTTLTANTWQHIEVTTGTSFNAPNIRVGNSTTNYLDGFVDEVKIYDYVRGPTQVKADYAARGSIKGVSARFGGGDQDYLSKGLVGYWKLDEASGNATDSSGNGTTLTDGSSTTYTSGKFGNGADLELGSTDYLYADDNATLSLTGDLTLSGWIKPESVTASTQFDIAGKWDGSNESYLLAQYGDEIRMYIDSASDYVETDAANLSTGTWYHVLGVYNSSNQTVKIYINGEGKATTTTGTIPSSIGDDAGNFYIGAENKIQTLTLQPDATDGIDNVLARNNDGADASTNYGTDTTVGLYGGTYAENLLIKFDLSSLAGATINSATLSLFSSQSFSDDGQPIKVSRILTANSAWAESTSSWNYLTNTSAYWAGDTGNNGGADAGASVSGTDYSSTLMANYDYAAAGAAGVEYPISLNTSEFTTMVSENNGIVVLHDSGGAWERLYFATSDHATPAYRPQLEVSYTALTNYYDGIIDDVRVYNRALSPKEVRDLYEWAPGPLHYWNFEEKSGTTSYDIGANLTNGTLGTDGAGTDLPTWTTGKYGGALNFDGSDDHVNYGDLSTEMDGKNFTFEAWVRKTRSSTNNPRIIAIGTSGATASLFRFYSTTTRPQLAFIFSNAGAISPIGPSSGIGLNKWAHIATTYDGTTLILWINGVQVDSDTVINDSLKYYADQSGENFSVGSTVLPIEGEIDEVRVYNYARTQKQIVSDMNAGHPAVGSPVGSAVAHWKLDQGYGTNADDSTPNNNDLTLSSASWTNAGKFGKAWNGTNAVWLSRADDSDFDVTDTDDYSVSLWFKSDSADNPGAVEYLFNKANATTAGYAVYADTSGYLCFGIDDDTTWGPDVSSCTSSDYYDNSWHHLVAVRDYSGTDKVLIYIDGVLKASASDTTSATLANSLSLYVGDRDGVDNGDEFTGDIDEVKVYRYALTADEIKTDFNRGSAQVLGALSTSVSGRDAQSGSSEYCPPGNTETNCGPGANPAPIGEWKFEEKGGQTAYDTSGSGKNGTFGATTNVSTDDPSWTSGKYGGGLFAAYPAAAGQYVSLGTNTINNLISGVGTVTINGWVNPRTNNIAGTYGASAGTIFRNWLDVSENVGIRVQLNSSGRLLVTTRSQTADSNQTATSTSVIPNNRWTHFSTVIDYPNDRIYIYINGILEVSQSVTFGATTYTPGTAEWVDTIAGEVGWWEVYDGKIDEIKIYNYARTPAQIAWDYNKGGPVLHWKLDECQGTTANDSSGNSNSGTINIGGSGEDTVGTCTTSSTSWGSGATGKFNSSLSLDGTDDYISVSDTANLRFDNAASDFSLFAWAKRTTTGTEYIISKEDADDDGYRLLFTSSNTVQCSEDATDVTSTATITDTNWHLIGCTIDRDGNGQVYIDGKADGSTSAMGSDAMATTSSLTIGTRSYTSTSWFNGQIDDVRIYNYALSTEQIKNIYNGGAVRFGPNAGSP